MRLKGVAVQGYRVASGLSTRDTRFPLGTIKMQAPFFAAEGLDLEQYFDGKLVWGTLDLDLRNKSFRQGRSDWFFKNIHWTDLQPAENFFLTKATIHYQGQEYKALWYHPDPSTKPNHFQYPTIMEFIAEKVPDIKYGDPFEVEIASDTIVLSDTAPIVGDPDMKAWL